MGKKRREWAKEFPELLKDWSENNTVKQDCPYCKKVIWKCSKGHEWTDSPSQRIFYKRGCLICSGQQIVKDNSFAHYYPNLCQEWHEKNDKKPEYYFPHSGKKVWWKCKYGHEWEATINGRTKGFGCPYCAGNLPTKENCLAIETELVKELSTKNSLNATQLMRGSSKKVWWNCPNGHEYQSRIADRVLNGSGCPFCVRQFSYFELRVLVELKVAFPNEVFTWRKKVVGYEVDILLENAKVGIEIDGSYWHRGKRAKDEEKNLALENIGVNLIRLREKPLQKIGRYDIGYTHNKDQFRVVSKLVHIIEKLTNVKSQYGDLGEFEDNDGYYKMISECSHPIKSAFSVAPHLEKDWHKVKNGMMTLHNLSFGSQKYVWWLCNVCGHEWEANVATRVKGHGCMNCYKMNRKPTSKACIQCGHILSYGNRSGLCFPCSSKQQRKVEWPSKEELEIMLKVMSKSEIGRKYDVTFSSLQRWIKFYKIGEN